MSVMDCITFHRSRVRYRGQRLGDCRCSVSVLTSALRVLTLVALIACSRGEEEAMPERDSLEVHVETGAAHYRRGQHDEAIAAFRKALDLAPRKPGLRYVLAMSLRAQHRHPEAAEELRQAVALAPHRAEYNYRYGEALLAIDDVEGAFEAFARATRLDSTHVDAHLDRARLLAQIDRLGDAETDFKRVLVLQPQSVWAHLGLGGVYTRLGRHSEAVAALRDAIALEPRNAHARYLLSQAYLRNGQHGEREEELKVFQRLSSVERHLKQGTLYAERGAVDRAIAAWEQAVQVDSTCVDAYLRLGQAHIQVGRPKQARKALRLVLELDPEQASAREWLAQMEDDG